MTAHLSYGNRWLLELVFNKYKSDECLDQTNAQGDFSVIGAGKLHQRKAAVSQRLKIRPRANANVQVYVPARMLPNLLLLYSPPDWETFTISLYSFSNSFRSAANTT